MSSTLQKRELLRKIHDEIQDLKLGDNRIMSDSAFELFIGDDPGNWPLERIDKAFERLLGIYEIDRIIRLNK